MIIHQELNGSAGEDEFRKARYTPYCNEMRPAALQHFVMIVGWIITVILLPIILVINVIIVAINIIIGIVIGLTFGQANIDLIPLVDITGADGLITDLKEFIVGCGRKHKTPFIHSYLSNIAKACGLQLKSSIFEPGGKYHNLMRLDAPFKKGRRSVQDIEDVFELNRPNLTGAEFLDSLRDLNIDWWVTEDTLCVERKDYVSNKTWLDFTGSNWQRVTSLCFDVSTTTANALAFYQYGKDGVDDVGDEALPVYGEQVIDWNTPANPNQKGVYKSQLPYGATRFRNDCIDPDVLTKYRLLYPIVNQYENVMIMSKGKANLPKLLMWDGASAQDFGLIERRPFGSGCWAYNEKTYIRDTPYEGNLPDNFYSCLFYIDNPRTEGIRKTSYSLTFSFNCLDLRTFIPGASITIPVCGIAKSATVSQYTINLDAREITVTGMV